MQPLASRAQARRVALRLQRFRRVELDFDGLAEVGHGFADELLRVFRHAHPEVDLVPVNMSPESSKNAPGAAVRSRATRAARCEAPPTRGRPGNQNAGTGSNAL
jgi:hypothetical protein